MKNTKFQNHINKYLTEFEREYPYLSEFFSSYMNEPYNDEETFAECIYSFVHNEELGISHSSGFTSSDPEIFKGVITDLDKLINIGLSEIELRKKVVHLGMWLPIDDNQWKPSSHTYKEWIVDLRNILQTAYDDRFVHKSDTA